MTDAHDELGPIVYLVVEFPGSGMTGEGLPILIDLVDRGIIRILDLVFLSKDLDGTVTVLELQDIDGQLETDLSVFYGASSGLLDETDIGEGAAAVEPGSSAGILIYENRWAAPFAAALRRGGAQLVASVQVPLDAFLETAAALAER